MIRAGAHVLHLLLLALLALSAYAGGSRPVAAAPSYDNCTSILAPRTTGSYMIEDPGTYCFNQDLAGEIGIEIWSDDVTIDCKGFRLVRSSYQEYSIGIAANGQRGLVVRNCDVRNYMRGIQLYTGDPPRDNVGYLVEDNQVHDNRFGIEVSAPGSIVRRNRVTGSEFGILASYGTAVLDNVVSGDRSPAGSRMRVGIRAHGQGSQVERNVVRGLFAASPLNVQGIEASFGARVVDNVVVGEGEADTVGIHCTSDSATVDDNVVVGFPAGLVDCNDTGDNDVQP